MPISHRRHGQDKTKTILSCLCQWCELNWRQCKTVFSSPQFIWDWTVANWKLGRDKTKLSCLVQFTPPTQTRQESFVLSVSAVWSGHYRQTFIFVNFVDHSFQRLDVFLQLFPLLEIRLFLAVAQSRCSADRTRITCHKTATARH